MNSAKLVQAAEIDKQVLGGWQLAVTMKFRPKEMGAGEITTKDTKSTKWQRNQSLVASGGIKLSGKRKIFRFK